MFIIATGVQHKRSILAVEIQKVLEYSQAITDAHILDSAVATVTQLSSSLKQHLPSSSTGNDIPQSFIEVDKFAPAQKNERQLQFKRTTNTPGRTKKMIALR